MKTVEKRYCNFQLSFSVHLHQAIDVWKKCNDNFQVVFFLIYFGFTPSYEITIEIVIYSGSETEVGKFYAIQDKVEFDRLVSEVYPVNIKRT